MSSVRSQLTVAVLNQITRVTQDKGNTCCPTWKEARTDAGGVDRRTHLDNGKWIHFLLHCKATLCRLNFN